MKAEVVATGIRFPEGPVYCADAAGGPGTLVCTSVADGELDRVHLADGRVERIAALGGGANAAALSRDGGFLVTQNGGIDFASTNLYPDPPRYEPVTPGLQRVWPDGRVDYIADDGFLAPNDLVVAADGTLWFTDPPPFPPTGEPNGRVHTMTPDGTVTTVASGFLYCNGIALEPDGTPVVVEAHGLLRLVDGDRPWIVEELPGGSGDGLCVDADGRLYVANTAAHGVRVLEPDGREVEFLALDGQGVTTNCCFGGADGRTLFATDGLPGHVVAWEGMPTPGLPLHPWPGP
ncbi:MAG TPA: SMP-30/gluconolactonase/LRE family protein [Acidimicrobiia bacterium]|nr:SMP-30/gluconolactonase/LRE family protein [Acidimicrobiia bacterium]